MASGGRQEELSTVTIMTPGHRQNRWQKIACLPTGAKQIGEEGRIVRDFWTSLDRSMHIPGVKRNRKVWGKGERRGEEVLN